jgi:hypothetical protein
MQTGFRIVDWLYARSGLAALGLLAVASACGSADGWNPSERVDTTQQAATTAAPGADTNGVGLSQVEFGSLAPIVNETGFISWSLDGMGTSAATGTIRVQKPSGATTRRAFLGSASTGFSGRKLANGDVTIDGAAVNWDISTMSSISSWNHWAEVTGLVKAKIDAAPAGIVTFTLGEVQSFGIDGESLAVIFDDPNQTTVNSVILLFGAQKVGGDTFSVALSDPINLADPSFVLDMSLGISFGYQEFNVVNQFSVVKVNGSQMSTSAGGQDDGQPANGALITVGGIGDTNADPPPFQTPIPGPLAYRTDDELYSLLPFVKTGDTSISVFSVNPSNDDNIFFAGLFVGNAAAIVGEGIVLGPENVTLNVGDTTTAVATVQDAHGNPVAGRTVTFTVIAGPNAGTTATAVTDASGKATFTYTGTGGPGVDEIHATFVDSTNTTDTSNVALRKWVATTPPSCALTAIIAGPPKQLQITVQDSSAGLQSVQVTDSRNATVTVPSFTAGDTSALVVVATKVDQSTSAHVALHLVGVDGTITDCDPVVPGDPTVSDNTPTNGAVGGGGCNVGQARGSAGLSGLLGALVGLAFLRRRRTAAQRSAGV